MDSYEIYRQANTLVRRYGTRDPEQIIKELGIVILCDDNFKNLLGMYTYRWKHRIIIYSSKIESYLKKMVLAHELGHDQRHRDIDRVGGGFNKSPTSHTTVRTVRYTAVQST